MPRANGPYGGKGSGYGASDSAGSTGNDSDYDKQVWPELAAAAAARDQAFKARYASIIAAEEAATAAAEEAAVAAAVQTAGGSKGKGDGYGASESGYGASDSRDQNQ